jgi:tryptophan synthase alpha subunit
LAIVLLTERPIIMSTKPNLYVSAGTNGADAAIVGSGFVKIIERNKENNEDKCLTDSKITLASQKKKQL